MKTSTNDITDPKVPKSDADIIYRVAQKSKSLPNYKHRTKSY